MANVYQVTYVSHTKTGKPIERSAKVTADSEDELEWELRNPRRTSRRDGRRGTRNVDSIVSYDLLGPELKIVQMDCSRSYAVSIRETDEHLGFVEPVGVPDFDDDYARRRYVHTRGWVGLWFDEDTRDPMTGDCETLRTERHDSVEATGWALARARAARQEA